MEKNFMKIYELILFSLSLIFIIFEILKNYYFIFDFLSWIGFIILLGMFIAWGVLRILLREKDLTNYEMLLLFITLAVVLPKLLITIYNFLGVIGWEIFGLSLEEFIVLLFFIFFFAAMFFWFYKIFKSTKKQEKTNYKLSKIDLFFLIFFIVIIMLLILYYIFS